MTLEERKCIMLSIHISITQYTNNIHVRTLNCGKRYIGNFFKVNLRHPNTCERLGISHSIQNSIPLCPDKSAGKDNTKNTIQ